MSALLKLVLITLCVNMFMYMGINYAIYNDSTTQQKPSCFLQSGDIFSTFLGDANSARLSSSLQTYSDSNGRNISYGVTGLNETWSTPPKENAGTDTAGGTQGSVFILDSIKIVYAFIGTLWNMAIMPISMFTCNLLPPLVAVMFGIPLAILNIITLIVLIRGGGAM